MPADLVLKAMNTAHRILLRVSGGRLGWVAMGMPVLELVTVGRRSGQDRSVMLTSPHLTSPHLTSPHLTSPRRENGNVVVVASRGGDDSHPAWFLNLRDEPRVDVVLRGGAR